jgi:hypothetical protein
MGEGPGGADVRIRLVVDDAANDATKNLKQGLHEANDELEHGKEHSEHIGSEMLKADIYVELFKKGAELAAEGMKQAWEMTEKLAEASLEAADEMNLQVRASAGLMSMMDQGAHKMGELRDYAREVREELAEAGTTAGVSTATMEGMFEKVIERGNLSTEAAEHLTEEMATVGKVVPRGMEGLAEGFNMMELGIVRARNPLVQLIAATDTLHGSARDVAKQMQHMSQAEQIDLATKAIEKQAALMKAGGATMVGPPSLEELKNSLGNIREGFLEAVGQPMLDHLMPPMMALLNFLMEHSADIERFGHEIGEELGHVIDVASAAVQGIYEGLHRNWDEVTEGFREILGPFADAWHNATSDSETIFERFGGMAEMLVHAFKFIADVIDKSWKLAEDASDIVHGRAAGTTQARMQQKEVEKDVATPGGAETMMKFDDDATKFRQLGIEAGLSGQALEEYLTRMREAKEATIEMSEGYKQDVAQGDTGALSTALNEAITQQNTAREAYILNTIGGSADMTRALMTGAIEVDGGFEALKKVIEDQAPELAAQLKKVGSAIKGEGGIKGHGPTVNFNGGQTFNFKNDFRDQDPDRVFIQFRKDLLASVTSRRQSRLASAFGL